MLVKLSNGTVVEALAILNADGSVATMGGGGSGGSAGPSIADALVVDSLGVYFYAVLTEAVAGGTPTISYINLGTGALGTPTGAVIPAASALSRKRK